MRKLYLIFFILLIIIGCDTDTPPDKMDPQLAAQYQRGIDALDRRAFAEAEQAFQTCLQMDANAHDARMQLARTYIRQQKFTSAEVELQMLIGLLNQAPEAKDKLSRAYLTLAQVFSYQQRFSDSTTALTNALDVNPDDTDARIKLGYFLGAPQQMLVPDLSASKRQFEKVLELEPNNLEAMLQLGLAEFRLGEADKASERFENIIQNYRRHSGAYYYLGVYHLRHGDPEKAVTNFKESLRLKPRDPETLWNLWTAYGKLGGYPPELPAEFKIEMAVSRQQRSGQPSAISRQQRSGQPSAVSRQHENPLAESQFINIAPNLKMDKVDGGRGSAWGDYDNDGDQDIVAVGTYQPHALYRNNGDGTFTDVADQAGIADPRGGWGSLFADYDNDGYPIFISRVVVGRVQQRTRSITTTVMVRSPMSHTPQGSPTRKAVSVPRGRIMTMTVIWTSTSQMVLSVMVPPMSYTTITAMVRSLIPLKVQGSRIPVIPLERLGGITIKTGILICMSSTSGNPMCCIAITVMAHSPMSRQQLV